MHSPLNARSYLQAVENLKDDELDRSKPFVPNLESSDQLMEESLLEGQGSKKRGRVPVIDATPLPVRKKAKRGKKVAEAENVDPVSGGILCMWSMLGGSIIILRTSEPCCCL